MSTPEVVDEQPVEIEHGTYGGYQAHKRFDVPMCEDCRIANNAYQADYRARNPDKQATAYAKQRAYDRALRKLARAHPTEFRALYDEELSR